MFGTGSKLAWVAALWAYVYAVSKQGTNSKVAELVSRSLESPIMKFTTADHNKFLSGTGRDYGMFVLFTATDPAYNCQLCKPAGAEFAVVVDSFRRAMSEDGQYFFAVFDFGSDVQKVFQKYEISSAPLLWYFPPKGKPTDSDKMNDMFRKGASADVMAKFLRDKSGVEFKVRRPTNWMNIIVMVSVFGGVAGAAYLLLPISLMIRFAKPLLGLVSMGCTLLFPTGYMWNQIRGAGWYTRGANGETEVWAKGSGNQTVAETYSLCMLHGAFALAAILLVSAPRIRLGKVPADIITIIGLAGAAVFLSLEWYLYRVHKNGGYPYSLLF